MSILGKVIIASTFLTSISATSNELGDEWRSIECSGDGSSQASTFRGTYERQKPAKFFAVFRYNNIEAQTVESTEKSLAVTFPIRTDKDGSIVFYSSDLIWTLTFFKATGRFELRSSRLDNASRSFVITNDTIAGACKQFEPSKVFE